MCKLKSLSRYDLPVNNCIVKRGVPSQACLRQGSYIWGQARLPRRVSHELGLQVDLCAQQAQTSRSVLNSQSPLLLISVLTNRIENPSACLEEWLGSSSRCVQARVPDVPVRFWTLKSIWFLSWPLSPSLDEGQVVSGSLSFRLRSICLETS